MKYNSDRILKYSNKHSLLEKLDYLICSAVTTELVIFANLDAERHLEVEPYCFRQLAFDKKYC